MTRSPQQIAEDCENLHGGEYMSLLREAARALRVQDVLLEGFHQSYHPQAKRGEPCRFCERALAAAREGIA